MSTPAFTTTKHKHKRKRNKSKTLPLAATSSTGLPLAPLPKDAVETELEAFLFGDEGVGEVEFGEEEKLREEEEEEERKRERERAKGEELFVVDTVGAREEEGEKENGEDEGEEKEEGAQKKQKKKAVWHDSADDASLIDISKVARLRKLRNKHSDTTITGVEYQKRLREVFTAVNPTADWAKIKPQSSAPSSQHTDALISSLLSTDSSLLSSHSTSLPPPPLSLTPCKDANITDPSQSVIQSLSFHPNGQLLLTAGLDKTLRLFQIDGTRNSKIQGIYMEDMPLFGAEWINEGTEIVCTGRRKYFYTVNVETGQILKSPYVKGRVEKSLETIATHRSSQLIAIAGKSGYIVLIDSRSKQWISNMKMNGDVRALSFDNQNSNDLYSTGTDGEIYVWDIRQRKIRYKHADEGCLTGSAIAAAGGIYAAGSTSGVVNIYDSNTVADTTSSGSSHGTVVKSIMNLTTAIDTLSINHSGELMCFGSSKKLDSFKLVHLASRTVINNWPTSQTPLHYVSAAAFSPNSGYLAVGNDRGRALLYRINHYQSA